MYYIQKSNKIHQYFIRIIYNLGIIHSPYIHHIKKSIVLMLGYTICNNIIRNVCTCLYVFAISHHE